MYWSFKTKKHQPVFFGSAPIIMVQWNITLNERETTIRETHFPLHHDYGRKGKPQKLGSPDSSGELVLHHHPCVPFWRPTMGILLWLDITWIYLVLMGSQLVSMVNHHGLYIYISPLNVVGPLPNGPNGLYMGVTKYLLSEVTLQVGIDKTSEWCVHVFYFWVCVANRCSSQKSMCQEICSSTQ